MTLSAGSIVRESNMAREELVENERAWLRRQARCACPRPLLDRVYLGLVACARCGKLTRFWRSALKRRVNS